MIFAAVAVVVVGVVAALAIVVLWNINADENSRPGVVAVVAVVGLVGIVLAAWAVALADPPTREASPATSPRAATAAGPVPGYDRSEFGGGWADVDGDGCDTRAEVLMRDMTRERVRDASEGGCLVLAGGLRDPYTDATGQVDASDVDVDHVVALADAWRSGAAGWDRARRVAFANDPANLTAARSSVNASKGARGPDEWLPPDPRDVCRYVTRYVSIKEAYGLTMTDDQREAVAATGCS